MEKIQNFSIDAGISLSEALNMPFWMLAEFYECGAWNIQKAHKENHDLMVSNVMTLLQNIVTVSKNGR